MENFWPKIQNERFVVAGSSGWFGRTLVDQLIRAGIPFICLGSHQRDEIFSGQSIRVHSFSMPLVKSFAPTIVADFAFLTREKAALMSPQEYVSTNQKLTNEAIELLELESVKGIVTVSSGASVHHIRDFPGNSGPQLYGQLKRDAEFKFGAAATSLKKSWVNLRAWSVSGPFVTNPHAYAFSRFIFEAVNLHRIDIKSSNLVFRRYVDVGDLIRVGLELLLDAESRCTLDSGGELVELEQLAHRIFRVLDLKPSIYLDRSQSDPVDDYFTRSNEWEDTCCKLGFKAKSLDGQISNMVKHFKLRS